MDFCDGVRDFSCVGPLGQALGIAVLSFKFRLSG